MTDKKDIDKKQQAQGIGELIVVAAQVSAAYILGFESSLFMQAIAAILGIQAVITAVYKFTK